MKKVAFFYFLIIGYLLAQNLTALDIMKKVIDILTPKTAYTKSKMIITTTGGEKRTFITESYAKNNGEKMLLKYLAPAQVKGQKTLLLNNADDIWVYFPVTNRVRKLATHAKKRKVQGSDFSYEDMGTGKSFISDYNSKIIKDTVYNDKKCYLIELIPKKGIITSYSKLRFVIDKKNFYPYEIQYFDEKAPDIMLKKLISYNIKIVDNIPTAYKMVMYNLIDNTNTQIELIDVKYNIKIPDAMFSERGLKR